MAFPDTELMKERIIKWLKADSTIYSQSNPQGDATKSHLKLTSILFGVPEEKHWDNELAPFLSVANSSNFVPSGEFFGSVVNDIMTSEYLKIRFDLTLVVQAFDAEQSERNIDYLHTAIINRILSNVQLKDTNTDGTLDQATAICETSRYVGSQELIASTQVRRLFAYIISFEIELAT